MVDSFHHAVNGTSNCYSQWVMSGNGQQHWGSKRNNQTVAGAAQVSGIRLNGDAWGLGWGEVLWEGVVAVMSAAASTATASWQQEKRWCSNGYSSSSISMGNNCCAVTVMLLKHLKGDNQPAQVEMVTLQQAATVAQRSFSGESNCQRKVFRSEKIIRWRQIKQTAVASHCQQCKEH